MKASGVPQRDALRAWHVALLYVALTAALAYPLVRHAASHVLSVSPDTDLLLWILSWDAHALTSHPLSIFDANIFAQLHRTLAFSENLIGSGLFAVPILGLTHNPVLAMNLIALLSCVLCGVGAFALARRAGAGSAGAAIGGLIFAFAPPRFLRLDQLFLATIQWMPFSLAYLHAYLDQGERGSPLHLRLAAAFFTLQAVTSGHGAVFLALASVALFGYRLILGAPLAVTKRLRDLGVTGVVLLAPIVPMALAYVRVQRDMGLKRSLADWVMATPTSFLASPTYVHSFIITRLLPGAHVFETATTYLFPGYVPLVLAAAALLSLMAAPQRANTIFYALLVAFCVWLSMGPPYGLWPLVYWLPGFNFIRAASRFMLLGTLGLSVLAAIGFDWISKHINPARQLAAAGVVACALVAEFAVPLDVRPYAVVIPAADRFVAHLPKPFTVAEVPLPRSTPEYEFEQRQAMFMLHSTEHWQKTVHGWSGLQPPGHLILWDRLTRFPDEASLRSLTEFQVDYIVVHTDLYSAGEWPEVERRLTAYRDRLELRYMDGTSRVYSRTAR